MAPAAVLGAAIGFGAQRIVQDLLSGFFIITEKQYGFGDLVELTVSTGTAVGTVEDVTLRITRLRTSDGEVVPVHTSADINRVNDVLRDVSTAAMRDDHLRPLLLDEPSLMGVESIEVDTVNLRMVARTLPGKQFEVGRRLRTMTVAALHREGIATAA